MRYLTGIAQSDTPEADTPKQDGANRSLFVYYDINEMCVANWETTQGFDFWFGSFSRQS